MWRSQDDQQPKLRVAIYIRVSTDEQAEMFGEALQLNKAMSFIEARSDLELAGDQYIYRDIAVSGADPIDERSELTRLFDDLEYSTDKPFDIVMVYKIDRFARKLAVLLDVVEMLKPYEVWFISTQESIDTNSPFWNAMLGILGVFAELERDMIKERTHAGEVEAKKIGRWSQDKFWYLRDENNRPKVCKEEADVIKDIFDMYVKRKMPIPEIARSLTDNKELVPWARPRRTTARRIKDPYFWRTETVRDILKDEVYIGNFYFNKSKRVPHPKKKWKKKQVELPKEERILSDVKHTKIITKKMFAEAQLLLKQIRKEYKQAKHLYLLSWLLKCDCCKELRKRWMVQRNGTTSNGISQYLCSWKSKSKYWKNICHTIPMPKQDLELLVIHYIKKFFISPELLDGYLQEQKYTKQIKKINYKKLDAVTKSIDKAISKAENIKIMFENGDLTQPEYKTKRDATKTEKMELEKKRIILEKEMAKQVDLETYQTWFKIARHLITEKIEKLFDDPSKTHKFLQFLIEEIVILSRPRKDSDTISWPKKKEQQVPYKIVIKFRLPQDFLDQLMHKTDHVPTPGQWFGAFGASGEWSKLWPTDKPSKSTSKASNALQTVWQFYNKLVTCDNVVTPIWDYLPVINETKTDKPLKLTYSIRFKKYGKRKKENS